ncbi:hypothetical protein, variant 1 [Puccinia triticina 1-1 BBBD Race 1]|uniref:DUF159-domain-containing protein n=2 Tax=Puccinia triticina TaxID=208348 RepID=A0A180GLE5_PUCT1|nr:uncharacterized protein PtA15_6A207 [Puccinia triticina]OAV93445.1 hypothetical protein, variant 1 [Puccinia triticina 1-1 BBBD Race 1]WAQ85579.1 hypothetical protein PtA15_6A207 [Puccinia triticina]
MCGRFALSLKPEEISSRLTDIQLHVDSWLNVDEYRPNYNLAPQNRAAVVRRMDPKENRLVIDCMKWGLVPHWSESPPTHGSLLNTINARDDKVVEPRGLWNTIKGKKRCIILCEGFFEWLTKGKDKIPHFTKRTGGQLMCLAGLWESVTYKGATEELHTFTIITTSSNKYLSFLHDRMPVILTDPESIETWLDTSSGEWSGNLAKLLKPFDLSDGLVCYPVPKEVGKVGNQSADFLKSKPAPSSSSANSEHAKKKGPVGSDPARLGGTKTGGPHDSPNMKDEPTGAPTPKPQKAHIKRSAVSVDSDTSPPEKKVRKAA